MKIRLYEIVDTINKEYDILLKEYDDHFAFEIEKKNKREDWYIMEYTYEIYVSYTLKIVDTGIELYCSQRITAKHHLQEFIKEIKNVREMAKDYL